MTGLGPRATGQLQAYFAQEFAQLRHPVRRRPVMDTIQRGNAVAFEKTRSRHVCGNHALLDQTVGIVACLAADGLDLLVGSENDTRLRGIEIDGPTALAGTLQCSVQCVQDRPGD